MDKIEVKVVGNCCACGAPGPHRNLVSVKITAPEFGTGWGCLICGLEPNGAIAILCDDCVENGPVDIKYVSLGYVNTGKRISIDDYKHDPFDHDLELHAEFERMQADLEDQKRNTAAQWGGGENG